MRIFTLLKAKTFFNLFLLVFLIGFSNQSYSQCPTVAITNQTFCDSQSPTVASLQASDNGGGIKWYATATSPASEFLLSTTPLESGETYYVDDNSGACGARQVVNVTIYSRPFALLAATTLCRESTIENLNPFVIGNNIKWYTTSTGGTALAAGTAISNGVYYASQTNPITGCETLRVGIVVEIKIVQPPTGVANQLICSDPAPTVANLVASGTNVSWFTTSTSGFPLDATTPLLNGQTYFAESFDSPCYSISRFPVTVTFASPNDAGTNGQINYCANQIASITPFDLYGLLNGNPDEGGVWTGPTITSNGYLGTVDVSSFTTAGSPYIYTYTVSSSINCPAVTSTITINVLPLPVASVSASPTTICENGNTALTFTGTPNAIVTYTVNGGTNQSTILNAGGTASINITLTADTVITIVSVASTGTPSCINTQPVTINITVEPLPTATVSANPTTICENGATTLTFTGTPNAIVTYTINGGANQSITLNTAGTATSNITLTADTVITIVSVATTGTPSCINTQPVTINITVEPLPTATVSANPTTICENGATTLTFTGTPNAIVTYTVNGGTNQTITLNATGTATSNITLTADTVITILSVATTGTPSCINTQPVTINITVEPLPTATVSSNPTTICENGVTTLTFTGSPNAIVTYTVNGGTNQTITLNTAGTATSNITLTANTVITIVSVATTGTPSCINTQPFTINITVEPLPTASVSANPTTICENESTTLTFTGTPNAVVTYTINGGANQTVTLNAAGTATSNITLTAETVITIVSVATTGTPSCINTQPVTINITVEPLPTATVSANPTTICENSATTLTFTGTPNAIVTYTINGGANQSITLNAAGTATSNITLTSDTVITIVSVTTTGTPSCINTQPFTINITVEPLPTASVSANPTTICENGATTLTFTGTPNAIVTYTVNEGINQTITLNGAGTATSNITLTTDTVITIVSVATTGTPSCINTQPVTINITVEPLPTATVSANPTTICENGATTLTFTGTPNAIVTYTVNGGINQTITLNAGGTATSNITLTADTVITIVSVATTGTPSCINTQPVTINITVEPLPTATVSANPTTICENGATTLTFTGTPNAIVTYTVNGGTNQTITLNATGTATSNITLTADSVITIVSVATTGTPSCINTQIVTINITVEPLPTASVSANPTTICENGASTLTFTGTPNAIVTYTVNGGTNQSITLNAAGTATSNITLTADTIITIVSVATTGTPSCINTQPVTINITVEPLPIAGVTPQPQVLCVTSPSIDLFTLLGNTAQTGGNWSPPLASGTGIFNPAIDVTGNYTYTVLGNSPCLPAEVTVQVTVNPIPNAGDDVADFVICSNQNPIDLFTLLGPNAQLGGTWSPALVSGTGILNPAVDTSQIYTYTVSGISPCVDDIATIGVTINQGPEAGNNNSVTLCVNSLPQDLFLALGSNAQPGGTWSPTLASGTGIFDPAIDLAGDYTYTLSGNDPCDNDEATITVIVNPIPDAGENGSHIFCTNDAPQDLFDFLTGTPQLGGTWSPTLASGTGVFDPMVDVAASYVYTVGGNLCDTDTATVTITVIQSPIAGADGVLTVCEDNTSLDLTLGLDGTQQAGIWSDDNATGALAGSIFNPSTVGVGTYVFTYTVNGGASPCTTDTATVTVTVNPLPNAGNFVPSSPICSSIGTFDLNTLLTGQDLGGNWLDATNTVITNPITVTSLLAGIHQYTYQVTNLCGVDNQLVQFEVLPKPQILTTNVTIAPVCIGNNVVVQFSGMADGTYTIVYDVTGVNTLTNQSQIITITSGTGSFTIPAASLTNVGNSTITFQNISNTVTNCQETLTNITSEIVIKPLLEVLANTVSVANTCVGNNVVVVFSNSNLPDGTYQFDYAITTGNPTSGNSGNVVFTGGNGQFIIPAAIFTTPGNYSMNITSIVSATECSNPNVTSTVNFVIETTPNSGTFNGIITICPADGTVDLFSLLDNENVGGVWTDVNSQVVTSPLNIANFAPATYSFTYTVTNSCSSVSTTVQFTILPTLNIAGATVSAQNTCVNFQSLVTISNATAIADGNYTITYVLSGANSFTETITIPIIGGSATFPLAQTSLTNAGSTTITITDIFLAGVTCGLNGVTFPAFTFEVQNLGTPSLVQEGNLFCETDNPTIANLSANILNGDTVVWFDAAIGGTAYDETDLLVHGTKYFAALVSQSGCEGSSHLEVIVDLTGCDDIVIPDGFSPNNDNINDTFEIKNLPIAYPNFKLEIFNRYGNLLYKGNKNTPNWDGTTSEKSLRVGSNYLPTGVYFYILYFNDGTRKPVQGRVYLSR